MIAKSEFVSILRGCAAELQDADIPLMLTADELFDTLSGLMYVVSEEVDDENIKRILEGASEVLAAVGEAL